MPLLTVQQAADKLGVSGSRIRLLIAANRFKAQKIGSIWLIEPRDAKLPKAQKPGRKIKSSKSHN